MNTSHIAEANINNHPTTSILNTSTLTTSTVTPALLNRELGARLEVRQRVLDIAAETLKTELFGLDALIDRLMDSVRAWYLLPELIDRPVIVCLWGLTGTGKTQIVRRLAQLLGFYDRFMEVQMDGFSNGADSENRDNIATLLDSSSLVEGDPGILLLDEFQRFKTIDRKGEDVSVVRYQDVWTLLSDGRLSPALNIIERIEMEQANRLYRLALDKQDEDEDDDKVDDFRAKHRRAQRRSPFFTTSYDALDIKRALKLGESITEIMRWRPEYVQQRLSEFKSDPRNWGTDHSKLLIFVTGNLDEMYQGVARRVQDCDTDADVFHAFTQRLSSIDVKEALAERFRPEQVARLGNQHLIFPSLTRDAYEQLIVQACDTQVSAVREALQLDVFLAPAIYKALYENAVFPVQGTRPVFSTVHAVLGPSLSKAAVWVIEQRRRQTIGPQSQLHLDLSTDQKQLIMRLIDLNPATYVRAEKSIPLHLEIDKLRKRAHPDFKALLAVHEAGHGLVYALLNHCAPTDVRVNVASFEGGYASYAPRSAESRRMARDEICVTLAGRAAEVWVFGKDAVSTGAEHDLTSATKHAARYQRHWAMGDQLSRVDVTSESEQHLNTQVDASNAAIEGMLQAEMQRAADLLRNAREPFQKLVNALLENGFVDAKQFAAVTGLDLPARNDALEPWQQAWESFSRKTA